MKVVVTREPGDTVDVATAHAMIRQWLGAFAEYRDAPVVLVEEPPAMLAGGTLRDLALAAKEEAAR